jgi:hypothetical protein
MSSGSCPSGDLVAAASDAQYPGGAVGAMSGRWEESPAYSLTPDQPYDPFIVAWRSTIEASSNAPSAFLPLTTVNGVKKGPEPLMLA